MTRWTFSLLAVGVAVVAGSLGSGVGPTRSRSFAQESRQQAAQAPEDSTERDLGWIGLMLENGSGGALLVKSVFPGGPAAFARIRQGDAVLQVAGVQVQSEDEFAKTVEQLKPGTDAVVVVRQNDKEQSLRVRVGSLREFHGHYTSEMWRRDPRDPNYTLSHGVSQADLSIELARRLFEQNERLEKSLHELRGELSELRRELQNKEAANR